MNFAIFYSTPFFLIKFEHPTCTLWNDWKYWLILLFDCIENHKEIVGGQELMQALPTL